jgi:RHS repeat-associated protein
MCARLATADSPATAQGATTNGNFSNYTNRSGFALFNRTAGGTASQLLNGGVNGRVGLAKTYRIYAGDKVKIEAYGKYTNATSTASNLSGFASALLAAYSLPAPVGGETGTPSAALNTWGGLVAGGSGGSGTVKAFVNIIVFDKNYKLIDFMWDGINPAANQVGATPVVAHDYMMREYTAKGESIVYMYVSNESPTLVDVYFDDVTMTYTPGNILQYNEYYPFGLSTANSWTRENTTGNNFLYNGGTELNTTTGVYDLHYRNYDPVLGRMNQVDPVASKYGSVTLYNYAFNSPAVMNDPLGDESVTGGKAYCSWCYFKPRPIDTGSGGGVGGGGGTSTSGVKSQTYDIDWATMADGAHVFTFNSNGSISYNYFSDSDIAEIGQNTLNEIIGFSSGSSSIKSGDAYVTYIEPAIYSSLRGQLKMQTNNLVVIGVTGEAVGTNVTAIVFGNSDEAHKYMWEKSFDSQGNVNRELAAFNTTKGTIVLPTEGVRRTTGKYAKNDGRNSYSDYIPIFNNNQTGQKLLPFINGTYAQINSQIHTHPNDQVFGKYEVESDRKFELLMGFPVFLIRSDGIYNLDGRLGPR